MRRPRLLIRLGRSSPEQARLITWTGAFLAATLCLVVWLGYEAVDSARSHQQTAENVVRDYVRVAAWTFRTRTATRLGDLLEGTFQEVPRLSLEQQKLPELERIRADLRTVLQSIGCDCAALMSPALLMRLDLRRLEANGSPRLSQLQGLTNRNNVTHMAQPKYEQHGAPVYTYLFSWQSPMLDGVPGAWHTAELAFCFDNTKRCEQGTGNTPEAQALARKMANAWANFARTGNPSQSGLAWAPFEPKLCPTMVFDNKCRMANDPEGEVRKILLTTA